MLAQLPPELQALVARACSLPDLYVLRLVSRDFFAAASREFRRRIRYNVQERLPEEFSTAVWAIRADGIRRGIVESPLPAFTVACLLQAGGMRADSLVALNILDHLAIDSAEAHGDLLAGLGTTKVDLCLILSQLLRLPNNVDLDSDKFVSLLLHTGLPSKDLVEALYKLKGRFLSLKWNAICSLEDWPADLAREKTLRTVSVVGLNRMYAEALQEDGDEDEVLVRFSEFLDSWDVVEATKAISHIPFSCAARGSLFGRISENVDDERTVADCLGILFGNGQRDQWVRAKDYSDFYASSHFPISCLFNVSSASEKFQAHDFVTSAHWTADQTEDLLEYLCFDDPVNLARVNAFFKTCLLGHRNTIVDYFVIHPPFAGLRVGAAIRKAKDAGLDDWARIVLAHYLDLKKSRSKLKIFLKPAHAFLGTPGRDPVKLGYLLASIFWLHDPVDGRYTSAWTLEQMRKLTKSAIDVIKRSFKSQLLKRDYSDYHRFLGTMARAIFEMLATGSDQPHLLLGLILGRGITGNVDNRMFSTLFRRSFGLRKAFGNTRDILYFLSGYLAPDSTDLHLVSNPPMYTDF